MILADFSRKDSDDRLCLTLEGHANYTDGGDDIVCAAVSGLFYALCGYLANLEDGRMCLERLRSGSATLSCALCGEEAMHLVFIGLFQIMLTYPENLSVTNSAFDWKIALNRAERNS